MTHCPTRPTSTLLSNPFNLIIQPLQPRNPTRPTRPTHPTPLSSRYIHSLHSLNPSDLQCNFSNPSEPVHRLQLTQPVQPIELICIVTTIAAGTSKDEVTLLERRKSDAVNIYIDEIDKLTHALSDIIPQDNKTIHLLIPRSSLASLVNSLLTATSPATSMTRFRKVDQDRSGPRFGGTVDHAKSVHWLMGKSHGSIAIGPGVPQVLSDLDYFLFW